MTLAINSGRDIVASYSLRKAIPLLIFICLPYAILVFGWYSPAESIESHIFRHGAYRSYALIGGTFCCLLLLPYLVRLFRQLFIDKLRAIWIEDGWIFHLNRQVVSCVDIQKISTGIVDRYDHIGIILDLRDGSQKLLPAAALSESADVIANRLRSRIELL